MNNREVIIQGEGILNLIPQRPPIVMVDSFFGIEENHLRGEKRSVSICGRSENE
jgi:hypothetical protein